MSLSDHFLASFIKCQQIVNQTLQAEYNLTEQDGKFLINFAAALAEADEKNVICYQRPFYQLLNRASIQAKAQEAKIKYLFLLAEFLKACPLLSQESDEENKPLPIQ